MAIQPTAEQLCITIVSLPLFRHHASRLRDTNLRLGSGRRETEICSRTLLPAAIEWDLKLELHSGAKQALRERGEDERNAILYLRGRSVKLCIFLYASEECPFVPFYLEACHGGSKHQGCISMAFIMGRLGKRDLPTMLNRETGSASSKRGLHIAWPLTAKL